MGIPLLKGRFFSDRDTEPNAPQVVIVDEKFAHRFWSRQDPVGKHVWFDPKKPIVVAGVIGAVKHGGLDIDGRMAAYFPNVRDEYVVARTFSDPAAAAAAIVREIRAADPSRPVYEIRTMQDRMSDSLARQRFSTIMLAAIGVYGVMSYLVTQSRHDIGLRIALGGIILGLTGALALTRVMSSLLFGIGARDIATFSTVPLILAAIALLATYIPAWRATEVDPMMVLREE